MSKIEAAGYTTESGRDPRDPYKYIIGDVDGKPFRIPIIDAIINLDPNRSAPHEDTDVFVTGIGWVPKRFLGG